MIAKNKTQFKHGSKHLLGVVEFLKNPSPGRALNANLT
jgi:hypothetical protein